MRVSWKTVYALCCVFFLLLLPFVYADESVEVTFTKDGAIVNEPVAGETLTLTSKLVSANSSDYLKFSLQDEKLKFVNNPNGSTINVYGRYVNDLWVYETEVEVLEDNPQLPKVQVIRDTTQPDLSESEKPQTLSIDLNSEQVVSPNDLISAKAILEPIETVNKNYFNFVKWHVSYGDNEIELENNSGESLSFNVPEEAINDTIQVYAEIIGSECGLNQDLKSETVNLKVQDNSLSVQIFPSTDSEGIIKGKFIGFSSEILRNGKVAESSISENSEYSWESKIGDEFLNGQKDNRTNYAVSPDRVGTLTVSLTVTLKNGITLKSQTITKTVVEEDQTLKSISLRKIENGESVIGEQIEVTKEFEPQYVTNLDSATYKWSAKQDNKEIAHSDKIDNFIFIPKQKGSISVTLEVTLKEGDPIISEPLVINVLESNSTVPEEEENPSSDSEEKEDSVSSNEEKDIETDSTLPESSESLKQDQTNSENTDQNSNNSEQTNEPNEPLEVVSGIIQSSSSTVNIGENVVMNAKLSTKGKDGNIEYYWKAVDKEGNILKESNQLKDFTFTSKKPGEVDVSFSIIVKNNQASSIEELSFQRLDLKDSVNFTDSKVNTGVIQNEDSDNTSANEVNDNKSNSKELENKDSNGLISSEESKSENKKLNTNNSESEKESNQSSSQIISSESGEKDLTNQETNSIKPQASITETKKNEALTITTEKNGVGLNTSSLNTNNPTPTVNNVKTSNYVPANTSNSVMNKSSNVVNPATGIELTIGQISVIIVCFILIVISIGIFIRKLVSLIK